MNDFYLSHHPVRKQSEVQIKAVLDAFRAPGSSVSDFLVEEICACSQSTHSDDDSSDHLLAL